MGTFLENVSDFINCKKARTTEEIKLCVWRNEYYPENNLEFVEVHYDDGRVSYKIYEVHRERKLLIINTSSQEKAEEMAQEKLKLWKFMNE